MFTWLGEGALGDVRAALCVGPHTAKIGRALCRAFDFQYARPLTKNFVYQPGCCDLFLVSWIARRALRQQCEGLLGGLNGRLIVALNGRRIADEIDRVGSVNTMRQGVGAKIGKGMIAPDCIQGLIHGQRALIVPEWNIDPSEK